MFKRLHRQLRRIRYYSASPEESKWNAAADWMLFATLLLAVPATFIADVSYGRLDRIQEQGGMLGRAPTGEIIAQVSGEDGSPDPPPKHLGRFDVAVIRESRGWPFVTSTALLPAEIKYNLFAEPDPRLDSRRAADEPLREAIASGLERNDQQQLLAAARRQQPSREPAAVWLWAVAGGVWWVLLYAAGMVSLRIVRFGALLHLRAQAARTRRWRERGQCEHCGYDLQGTEFSERCPECGELA